MSLNQLLSSLHEKTATELLKRIESGEATAAEFTAAINLLKHNNIQCQPGVSKHIDKLAESLLALPFQDRDQPAS
jgi:hypothetical protein